jgi:hypothetical protein
MVSLDALAMAAAFGGRVAQPPRAEVAPLQRRRVLRTLGIPRLGTVKLRPVFRTGFERDPAEFGAHSRHATV